MAWTKEQWRIYFREYRRGKRRRKDGANRLNPATVPYGISPEFRFFAKVKLS